MSTTDATTEDNLRKWRAERQLHDRKASVFYTRQKATKNAKQDAFYFEQRPVIPNLSTDDVFYRCSSFIPSPFMSWLGIKSSAMSMMRQSPNFDLMMLSPRFGIFCARTALLKQYLCDSCHSRAQSKNYTVFRFLYTVVLFSEVFLLSG